MFSEKRTMSFCMLLILSSEIYATKITRVPNFQYQKNLRTLDRYSFVDIRLATMYQCGQLCYAYSICKSIGFDTITGLCRLSMVTRVDVKYMVFPKGTIYMEKILIPKEIIGVCFEHKCDIYSQCVETSGIASCIRLFSDKKCEFSYPEPHLNASLTSPVPIGTYVDLYCIPPLVGVSKGICSIGGVWTIPYFEECAPDFCDTVHVLFPGKRSGPVILRSPEKIFYDITVFCVAEIDRGDWLVIQRRVDITSDFNYNETMYAKGFGDIWMDYWIGTRLLSQLTSYADVELRVDFNVTGNATKFYAKYDRFFVDANLILSIGSYVEGNSESSKLIPPHMNTQTGQTIKGHNWFPWECQEFAERLVQIAIFNDKILYIKIFGNGNGDGLSYMNGFIFNVSTIGGGGWWWHSDRCEGTNLNAEQGGFLKWTDDCKNNNSISYTNIESTLMMIRRKTV